MFVEVETNSIAHLISAGIICEAQLVQYTPQSPIKLMLTVSTGDNMSYDFAKFDPEDTELASEVLRRFMAKVQVPGTGTLTLESIFTEMEDELAGMSDLEIFENNLLGTKMLVSNEKYNLEKGKTRLTLDNVLESFEKIEDELEKLHGDFFGLKEDNKVR